MSEQTEAPTREDVERSVAMAVLWDHAVAAMTATALRAFVRRLTTSLLRAGWTPPADSGWLEPSGGESNLP